MEDRFKAGKYQCINWDSNGITRLKHEWVPRHYHDGNEWEWSPVVDWQKTGKGPVRFVREFTPGFKVLCKCAGLVLLLFWLGGVVT